MKLDVMKTVNVEAKTLKIYTKVCDRFSAQLVDQDGNVICDQDDGYVPSLMPGDHYGDYIILNIDIDNGNITNWEVPTKENLQDWLNELKEADEA